MKLSNSFSIARPPGEVYDAFLDIERVATCMPGSRMLGQPEPGTYEGEVKVKVGPLGVVYTGRFTVIESDRDALKLTMRAKDTLALQYADLVYNGQWFTPLKGALDAFVDKTQEPVTGDVRLKLYKGTCEAVGMKSPYSLYDEALATFGEDDVYQQSDAEGFIRLFGLGQKVANQRDRNALGAEVAR